MLALCLVLSKTYYAQNHTGIIDLGLLHYLYLNKLNYRYIYKQGIKVRLICKSISTVYSNLVLTWWTQILHEGCYHWVLNVCNAWCLSGIFCFILLRYQLYVYNILTQINHVTRIWNLNFYWIAFLWCSFLYITIHMVEIFLYLLNRNI